jgi:hypothetical protein
MQYALLCSNDFSFVACSESDHKQELSALSISISCRGVSSGPTASGGCFRSRLLKRAIARCPSLENLCLLQVRMRTCAITIKMKTAPNVVYPLAGKTLIMVSISLQRRAQFYGKGPHIKSKTPMARMPARPERSILSTSGVIGSYLQLRVQSTTVATIFASWLPAIKMFSLGVIEIKSNVRDFLDRRCDPSRQARRAAGERTSRTFSTRSIGSKGVVT